MKKAIFAGSFDPIHEGHIKIINKASKMFDELYVVVANNDFKNNQTEIKSRLELVKKSIALDNTKVVYIQDMYLADFAKNNKIKYLIRSARNDIDFNYELDMAKKNREINNELETILIIPDYENIKYSSSKFKKL